MKTFTVTGSDVEVSDGYHTMRDLYRHRLMLTATLFNLLRRDYGYDVKKSKLHSDGTMFEDSFIVTAILPVGGQISYHYPLDAWDLFKVPELERAAAWDGHTSDDVLDRLESFCRL